MDQKIDRKTAISKLEQLMGKKVSGTFNAYGYILYLDFGELTTRKGFTPGGKKLDMTHGEFTLVIDGIWKFFEHDQLKINCVTAERDEIDLFLKKLINASMSSFSIDEQTHLTEINFSNEVKLTIQDNKDKDDSEHWAIREEKTGKWFCFEKS